MHAARLWIAILVLVLLIGCAQPIPTSVPLTATSVPPTETLVPPTPTPAPPTVDVAMVQTEVAATVMAQMMAQVVQMAAQMTATAAARPTETPVPTETITPTPAPSDTSEPTAPPKPKATAAPKFTIKIENPRYEQWGRPVDGCRLFDNRTAVRKFNMEVTLTNNTSETIDNWFPRYYSSSGQELLTCFYLYGPGSGFPAVPPGDSRTVTYAAFCELNEYVTTMRIKAADVEQTHCFSPEGQVTGCP